MMSILIHTIWPLLAEDPVHVVGIPVTSVAGALAVMVGLLVIAITMLWRKLAKVEKLVGEKEQVVEDLQKERVNDITSLLRETLGVQKTYDNVLLQLNTTLGANNEAVKEVGRAVQTVKERLSRRGNGGH